MLYTLRDPNGDPLGRATELGGLQQLARELAARLPAGDYAIDIDGEPWGWLQIEGDGPWQIATRDASVTMGPGYIIV